MKVLILSCNTGEGHNSAAKALQEVLISQNDECIIKDSLSFYSKCFSEFICNTYVDIVNFSPKLFGKIYFHSKKIKTNSNSKIKSFAYCVNSLYSKKLEDYINDEKFDFVIITHIFAGLSLTHLKRHKRIHIPFYFVATDYSCTPLLSEAEFSKIFYPHEKTIDDFINQGIDKSIMIPSGIPISQKFINKTQKQTARISLNLEISKKIILIMSGSMGHGNLVSLTKNLILKTDDSVKILVITGNNKKLYKNLIKEFSQSSKVIVKGFTDKISLYMDACDLIMTKPGGLSSTEALNKFIPIIHINPIPGCETENAEFFSKNKLSIFAKDIFEATDYAIKLMQDNNLYNEIQNTQRLFINENSALYITNCIKNSLSKEN